MIGVLLVGPGRHEPEGVECRLSFRCSKHGRVGHRATVTGYTRRGNNKYIIVNPVVVVGWQHDGVLT